MMLFTLSLLLGGCKGSEKVAKEETAEPAVEVVGSGEENLCLDVILDAELYEKIQHQPVSIVESRIEGNLLYLKINFSGCTYDELDLVWNNMLKKSYPGQAQLKLGYTETGSCDEIQTKEMCFNLKSFAEFGKVVLFINEAEGILFESGSK
ncbi:MAG: hypothetical protein CL840_09155 [Crocinitomicaceae bacterium]|nr:hypothetical protein [Crocinitomicaceae bacterium]|tara:strand:- start:1167 stop:1619 length:453 start_codon:yes stop_codon:yes gene_type:complete